MSLKKMLTGLTCTLAAICMVSTAALAGTLTVKSSSGSNGPLLFPIEAYPTSATADVSYDVSKVTYKPGAAITGADLYFTFTNMFVRNAGVASSSTSYYLYGSDGSQAVTVGGALVPGVPTGNFIKFAGIGGALSTSRTYIVKQGVTNTSTRNYDTMNVTLQGGLALGATASLTVKQTFSGTDNDASTATFLTLANGLKPAVTKANAVVDVNKQRKQLLENSTTNVTFEDIPVTIGLAGSGASFYPTEFDTVAKIATPTPNVKYVLKPSTTQNIIVKDGTTVISYSATDAGYPLQKATATPPTFRVEIADTNVVIDTRTFSMTAVSVPAATFSTTSYGTMDAGAWTLNGYQALLPYLNTNSLFGTQILLNNTSSTDVDVFWDVTASSDSAVSGNLANYSNKRVTGKLTIGANSTVLYNSDEIVDALDIPLKDAAGNYSRNQIRVTVTAPIASVTGMAIQADGTNGKRNEPLFTGSANDYKIW